MPIMTNSFPALLRRGLHAIVSELPTYPQQFTNIYQVLKSSLFQEMEVEMRGVGLADTKEEGMPGAIDSNLGQRILTNYVHRTISLTVPLTQEAIEDNQYPTQFPQLAVGLRTSLRVTKDIFGANLLNNAFNPQEPVGDGQPICSTSHPIDGGVYSNSFVPAPNTTAGFSEATLESMIVQVQGFVMQSGLPTQAMPRRLIVPRQLQFDASRVLNTAFKTSSANNDVNAIYHGDYIPEGYFVNQYLSRPGAFFMLTDSPDGFKMFQRRPVNTDTDYEFISGNVLLKADERYSMGITNCRAVLGNKGA